MRAVVEFRWLGRQDYASGLFHQRRAAERVRAGGAFEILALEHSPVVTLGRTAVADHEIYSDRMPAGLPVVATTRGGQATLHAPGQLVVYPVLSLRHLELGVRDYVDGVLRATQRVLSQWNIVAEPNARAPGLYTAVGKIAFVGVRIDRGMSQHGLSLNVDNDLRQFSWIRSCGIEGAAFDRVCDYRPEITVKSAAETLFFELAQEFNLTTEAPFPTISPSVPVRKRRPELRS